MTNHAKVGGILSIISGALGILTGLMFFFMIFFLPALITSTDPRAFEDPEGQMFFNFMAYFYGGIGVFFVILGVLAIVGGVYALKKKLWGLALTGAICGTIISFPTGIPAIIFTVMGKPEFAAPVPPAPTSISSSAPTAAS